MRYSVTRCPDPSPSSTDISVAEKRFGFGMVVEFTLVGFEGGGDGGAKVLTYHSIIHKFRKPNFSDSIITLKFSDIIK